VFAIPNDQEGVNCNRAPCHHVCGASQNRVHRGYETGQRPDRKSGRNSAYCLRVHAASHQPGNPRKGHERTAKEPRGIDRSWIRRHAIDCSSLDRRKQQAKPEARSPQRERCVLSKHDQVSLGLLFGRLAHVVTAASGDLGHDCSSSPFPTLLPRRSSLGSIKHDVIVTSS
jgi:hypothetical protein